MFLIDIAVPGDIEPGIANVDNVYLYNIDDLQSVVAQNIDERTREIEKMPLPLSKRKWNTSWRGLKK